MEEKVDMVLGMTPRWHFIIDKEVLVTKLGRIVSFWRKENQIGK
jgi:hypothetical protein